MLLAVLVRLVHLLDHVVVQRVHELIVLALLGVEDKDEVEHCHGAALLLIRVIPFPAIFVPGSLRRDDGDGDGDGRRGRLHLMGGRKLVLGMTPRFAGLAGLFVSLPFPVFWDVDWA